MAAEAAGAGEAGDALPHGQVRHPVAQGADHACVLRAGHERQGRLDLVLVLHDQQVGEVQARRFDFNQHFAGLGHGGRHLRPLQGIDAGGRGTQPSLHECLLLFSSRE
ncbi:hypothetical protein D3C78_1595140 [compost metagenome]